MARRQQKCCWHKGFQKDGSKRRHEKHRSVLDGLNQRSNARYGGALMTGVRSAKRCFPRDVEMRRLRSGIG